jgi:hypothetical protein
MDRLATKSWAQASKFVKWGPGVPEGETEGADIAIMMQESSRPIGPVRVRDQCVTQSGLNAFRFKDHTSNSDILSGSSQMKSFEGPKPWHLGSAMGHSSLRNDRLLGTSATITDR